MDKLKKVCEEFLGQKWEIKVNKDKTIVSYVYVPDGGIATTRIIQGATTEEVIDRINREVYAKDKGVVIL